MQDVHAACKPAGMFARPSVRTTGLSAAEDGEVTRDKIVEWCNRNPGFPVIVSRSSSRPISEAAIPFVTRLFGRTFMVEREGLCMLAVVVNGVHALRGEGDAVRTETALMKEIDVGGSVASMAPSITQLGLHLRRQRIRSSTIRNFDDSPLFMDRTLLVCLFCGSIIDHTICVETRRQLILDSCERCPLLLRSESLYHCTGGIEEKSRIEEVRELTISRLSSSN